MQLRLLDEVSPLNGRGVLLFSMDEANAPKLWRGARIVDVRGAAHTVKAIEAHEGVYSLYLPQGEAAYFERLFRDVRVDATLFTVEEDAPCP